MLHQKPLIGVRVPAFLLCVQYSAAGYKFAKLVLVGSTPTGRLLFDFQLKLQYNKYVKNGEQRSLVSRCAWQTNFFMDYTQSIGNVVELQCISKFIEMGFQCSIPYGNSAKYDFIAELPNGELIKIQCKSAVWERKNIEEKSAFHFSCQSSTTNTKQTVRYNYTKEQIDYFATYFEGQVYLVPVEECSTQKTLRILPPKNGNTNYSKAEDYTIEKVLGHLQNEDFVTDLQEHNMQINMPASLSNLQKYTCEKCGAPIWKKGSLCRDCYILQQRIVERPDRETLKMLIRTKPFTVIGRDYGVSDNAVRKWCDAEKLPRKSREIKSYSDEEWSKL